MGEGEGSALAAFGVAGITKALQDSQGLDLPGALDHLFQASHAYTGGLGRHDDTSVLLLERT